MMRSVKPNSACKTKGFTLIELMIVVLIIGILLAVALPNYQDYALRSKVSNATSNLSDLRTRMERYYQDNRTYQNVGGGCGIAMPSDGSVDGFNFACVSGTANSYQLTANGVSQMSGFRYQIDQNGNKTSTSQFSGGSRSGSCWLVKSGSCS